MEQKINISTMSLSSLRNHVASALEIVMRTYDNNINRIKKAGWTVINPYDNKQTKESLKQWLIKHLPDSYYIN